MKELTLLKAEQILKERSAFSEKQLEVLKKYGTLTAITDLAILTGGYVNTSESYINAHRAKDDNSLRGRTGRIYTQSTYLAPAPCNITIIDDNGYATNDCIDSRSCTIRPVLLLSPDLYDEIYKNRVKGYNGIEEVEYGEYPQYAPSSKKQQKLQMLYDKKQLQKTGGTYTFDSTHDNTEEFVPITYDEYEYNGSKYIRVKMYSYFRKTTQLSNGETYDDDDYVWLEITPVVWLIDEETKSLISKRGILSGIRYCQADDYHYTGEFKQTNMKKYLDKYMLRDLFQTTSLQKTTRSSYIQSLVNAAKSISPRQKENTPDFLDTLRYLNKDNINEKEDVREQFFASLMQYDQDFPSYIDDISKTYQNEAEERFKNSNNKDVSLTNIFSKRIRRNLTSESIEDKVDCLLLDSDITSDVISYIGSIKGMEDIIKRRPESFDTFKQNILLGLITRYSKRMIETTNKYPSRLKQLIEIHNICSEQTDLTSDLSDYIDSEYGEELNNVSRLNKLINIYVEHTTKKEPSSNLVQYIEQEFATDLLSHKQNGTISQEDAIVVLNNLIKKHVPTIKVKQ